MSFRRCLFGVNVMFCCSKLDNIVSIFIYLLYQLDPIMFIFRLFRERVDETTSQFKQNEMIPLAIYRIQKEKSMYASPRKRCYRC